jgi:putative effector of murein hydrolase
MNSLAPNHYTLLLFNFILIAVLSAIYGATYFANKRGGRNPNVMRVAVMSSPLPFAWQVSPPLRLIFQLPFAFIVPVCVGGALAGHIILTRALLLNRTGRNK